MSSVIFIFNVLCIPFVTVYFLFRAIDVPLKPSLWVMAYYIFAVCAIGVPAKLTAMLIATVFEIIIYHYQPAYSFYVLFWAFVVYIVSAVFVKNIKRTR